LCLLAGPAGGLRLSVNKKLSQADFSNIGAKPKKAANQLISLAGKIKMPLG
jgi:hypothetical protein